MDDINASNNQFRADNQQGRLDPWWITGFVDGEGCFSISIFKNVTTKAGVQVFPEFVVTQGAKSRLALKNLQDFFGCGRIYENKRQDNHRESLYRYCVRSKVDLRTKIIPFFQRYPLKTSKHQDFLLFCKVMDMIENKVHLMPQGLMIIRELAAATNRRKTRI